MKPSEFIEKIASGELRGAEARRVAAQTEVKQWALELERDAEAMYYVDKQIFSTGEAKAVLNETGDGGYSCGQTWVSLGFGGTTDPDYIYEGKDLLECVRKARGEE